MNRTNSVEPVFSQPLQVTYHQLLQNKTKIEDELYQTQRQLRRKEGEYLKKIAVYEQKIDQMQEQIDEFSGREESTKSMYEKILSALNCYDKSNNYAIDMERIQDMIMQMRRSHHNSPTNSEKSKKHRKELSASMKEHEKQQIETLETSLSHLNESYQKMKTQYSQKEKDNQNLTNQIKTLKQNIKKIQDDHTCQITQLNNKSESALKEVEDRLNEQYTTLQKQSEQSQLPLQQRIRDLQNLQNQQIQFQDIQSSNKLNQLSKDLQNLKQYNEKAQKDIDNVSKERDIALKERDTGREQLKDQEVAISKLKKQLNQAVITHNENTKKLKAKIQSIEKDVTTKNEEISKLSGKMTQIQSQLKSQQNVSQSERKSSAQITGYNTNQVKSANVGNKDQQVSVDIQTNEKVGGTQTSKTNRNFKVQNRGSIKNKSKMFSQPINININNEGDANEVCLSNSQQRQSLQEGVDRKNVSRNSNVMNHSSMVNLQSDYKHSPEKQRTLTPNSRQMLDLNDTIQQPKRITSNQRKALFEDSVNLNSSTKNNSSLHKYINMNSKQESDSYGSRSISQNVDSMRQQHLSQLLTQQRSQENTQQIYLNESEKALLSSLEIEEVVRRMLDSVYSDKTNDNVKNQDPVQITSQYYNMQTPSQNVSFSQRKHSQHEERPYQQMNGRIGVQSNKNCVTIDKEFLTKLENSLKKLTKSNEKIKQIMKEKENFEQQCLKLKQKVKLLKEEKGNILADRENLISQNHKMECKLKQAQIILNLEGESQNHGYQNNNNNSNFYDQSQNSQQTITRHFQNRDISPGGQSSLTLNIIQDHSNDRYQNPPMSCRVNDSYDLSLRLHPDSSYKASGKKPMFHNTLNKQSLDQSLITVKKDKTLFDQQDVQVSQFNHRNPKSQTSLSNKFQQKQNQQPQLVNQHSTCSTYRGKTPTLLINLSQSPNQKLYSIDIGTSNNDQQRSSNNGGMYTNKTEIDDSGSVITSRNFSRSTTNLMSKKNFQPNTQSTLGQSQQTTRQLYKYSSNREGNQFRSPQQMIKHMNNGNNEALQKSQNMNYSSMGIVEHRDKSPQPFVNIQNTSSIISQASSVNILRRMNSSKAKDRYYTNNRNTQPVNENIYLQGAKINRIVTFDEEEEDFIDEQTIEEEQHNNMYSNSEISYQQKQEEEYEESEGQDTDENNVERYSSKSESSMKIKVVPLPKKQSQINQNPQNVDKFNSKQRLQMQYTQQMNNKIFQRRDDGVVPSDERELDEESVQYKLLNNSNFIPSMHSRYVNDELQ